MYQVITRSDGSKIARRAGRYELHATHGHVHYEGFARYELFEVDPETGQRKSTVGRSRKSGFCLVDLRLVWWARLGNEPRRFSFPACNVPSREDGSFVMGISRGWSDIYTWDLPDQYVEITGLGDGLYELVSDADAAGRLKESDESDNSRSVFLEISGDEVRKVRRPRS